MQIDFSDIGQILIDMQIEEFEDYLNTLEKLLKNELEHFEKIVEAQAKAISDDSERNEFYEYQSNEYWKLNESFVRILRNSFLITIFSFMENRIDAICDKLQKKHRMQISWRDLRGDILDRGALYIENFVGHSPNEISVWSNIRNYQKIRNSIVHNDGQIQEEAVIDYASKRELIHPVDKKLFLTEEFCREVITNLRVFFKELYALIKKL